jgi:hypothetical protein
LKNETKRLLDILQENGPKNLSEDNKSSQKVLDEPISTKTRKKCEREKKFKKATVCIHTDRPNYAKNMCNYCYHKIGRANFATECPHTDRPLYCHKKCMSCYNMAKH